MTTGTEATTGTMIVGFLVYVAGATITYTVGLVLNALREGEHDSNLSGDLVVASLAWPLCAPVWVFFGAIAAMLHANEHLLQATRGALRSPRNEP